jgi:hypothetical protein
MTAVFETQKIPILLGHARLRKTNLARKPNLTRG